MWTALRVLEEHAAIQKRLADRARHQNFQSAADQFERYSEETRRQAHSLRSVLLSRPIALCGTARRAFPTERTRGRPLNLMRWWDSLRSAHPTSPGAPPAVHR
ncbi:MAG TPA: hypothetical protein VF306_11605 [Pirellulales bacterium]